MKEIPGRAFFFFFFFPSGISKLEKHKGSKNRNNSDRNLSDLLALNLPPLPPSSTSLLYLPDRPIPIPTQGLAGLAGGGAGSPLRQRKASYDPVGEWLHGILEQRVLRWHRSRTILRDLRESQCDFRYPRLTLKHLIPTLLP